MNTHMNTHINFDHTHNILSSQNQLLIITCSVIADAIAVGSAKINLKIVIKQ